MALKLMTVVAHPDDESLGLGGTLAKYAAEDVETSLVTATRGQRGKFCGHCTAPEHPGAQELARIREAELYAAAEVLGIQDVVLLDHVDQELDAADPRRVTGQIVHELRRVRPDVVVTFAPDGAYGHPDHIAISQLTTAAVTVAADPTFVTGIEGDAAPAHRVSKLYYLAWPKANWDAYQAACRTVVSNVDGVVRAAVPWPDWALTTTVDTRKHWETVWRAVSCHRSQVASYAGLTTLAPHHHEALWGWQSFYRAFSLVNGGRRRELDLFEGLRS